MRKTDFRVRRVDFDADFASIKAVREAVFVHEQGVPIEQEWDDADRQAQHVVAETAEGVAVGTGRLLPDGHIGRMAVLQRWRNQGIGSAMLAALIEQARQRGDREVLLSAQIQALAFYRRHGFSSVGKPYLEVGIPHQRMVLKLRS